MEFRFGEQEERLRQEVRAFLQEHLRPTDEIRWLGYSPEVFEAARAFHKKLAARGWLAPAWPKEYGGLGASIYEQMVFNEELGYANAPDTGIRTFSVGMLGPTLILHGTDEQKREHLPPITAGDVIWCQGYSEPGAGSDLAALQTRAVRDGDDYVITGHKIWISNAHRADWMFLLARTDPQAPKHQGISFFLLDLRHSPGVTIRPIYNLAGGHYFNEVFFEDVRVPRKNLVGEENRGWYVAMTLLDFERSNIGATAAQRRTLEELAAYLRAARPAVRARHRLGLAELVIANNVARHLGYRIGYLQASGGHPNYEASVVKVFGTELDQRVYQFALGVLGLGGQLLPGDPRAPIRGKMPVGHLAAVAPPIYGGTNEIQRNIIATRGLGLPRE